MTPIPTISIDDRTRVVHHTIEHTQMPSAMIIVRHGALKEVRFWRPLVRGRMRGVLAVRGSVAWQPYARLR